MKKIFTCMLMMIAHLSLFALGWKNTPPKINVLPSYTSMSMDLVSSGNTVYEAVIATDQTDASLGTVIFINRYDDSIYRSTMRIDVEGFKTWEFSERFSHYDFLKLYALSPDEIILTLYSSYSDNRFAFFRIKNEEVVAFKSYSLKNQQAYESQCYAFDGKDTVYVAFNGSANFKSSKWDLYLMSFDLDGNIKNSVSIFTRENDELIALEAFEDSVYFGISQTFEKQALIQLTKNLEFEKCLFCKYPGSGIRFFDCSSDTKNLLVNYYMENQTGTFVSRFSSRGDFISSYIIEESSADTEFNYCKSQISEEGILYFGRRVQYDETTFKLKGAKYLTYFMDWNGNKLYEKEFVSSPNLDFKKFAKADGGFFCSGENFYESDGIGHTAYTYLIDGKTRPSNYVSTGKSDLNPFAPREPDLMQNYANEISWWETNLEVERIEIPSRDFGYKIKSIRLPIKHLHPDSKEIRDTIPLFPFSER